MPWRTRQNSSPSSRFQSSAPSSTGGHIGSAAASGPSPRPSAPWQRWQCSRYSCCPCTMPCAAKPVGERCRLVATAGANSRCACGQGASTIRPSAAGHSHRRPRRHGIDASSASTASAAHSRDSDSARPRPGSIASISAASRYGNGQAGWPCSSGARPSAWSVARRPFCAARRPSSSAVCASGASANDIRRACPYQLASRPSSDSAWWRSSASRGSPRWRG